MSRTWRTPLAALAVFIALATLTLAGWVAVQRHNAADRSDAGGSYVGSVEPARPGSYLHEPRMPVWDQKVTPAEAVKDFFRGVDALSAPSFTTPIDATPWIGPVIERAKEGGRRFGKVWVLEPPQEVILVDPIGRPLGTNSNPLIVEPR